MVTTVVTAKGQIVIPSKVRNHYGIKKGTHLCIIEKKDEIVLKPLTHDYFSKMAGILQSKKSLVQELIADRARDKESEDGKCKK
ncbi:MAG: AbrB/MazE/SpoVT family DNA-binding domain-containing protein [Planctomycetota bacterium]